MARWGARASALVLAILVELCASANNTTVPCVSGFAESDCYAGTWPVADLEADDSEWWPSRSTHYGSTSGAACGWVAFANCRYGNESGCENATKDMLANDYAGKYAAPQGNYYAQTNGYLSCGECFQVRCVDPLCQSREPVNLRIVDSCPCLYNEDWCCGKSSDCVALNLADDGSKHCPKSGNISIWDDCRSIHLDLSDTAMNEVVLGKNNNGTGSIPGAINTYARRVSCNVTGNMYVLTSPSCELRSDCTRVHPQTDWCFQWFSAAFVNIAGAGSVWSAQVWATYIINNTNQPGTNVSGWLNMTLADLSVYESKPQEQYGQFKVPDNTPIFFPIKFRMQNRYGQEVTTNTWQSYADWKIWWDSGVQFPLLPSKRQFAQCPNVTNASSSSSSSSSSSIASVKSSEGLPVKSIVIGVVVGGCVLLFSLIFVWAVTKRKRENSKDGRRL